MRTLVLVLVALLSSGCLGGPTPGVTLASCGMEGYEGFERQVLDILAQSGIPSEVYLAGEPRQAAGMVARGQAQLALLPADVTWDLYRSEPSFRRLRGIAIAGFLDLHILQATAGPLESLRALDGLRVGLEAGDGRRYLAGVLNASGIRLDSFQCLDKTPSQSIKGLQEGTLDAAMFFLPQGAPGVGLLLEDEGFAWVELEHTAIQRLKEANPFLAKASVPAETYRLPTDGRTLRLPLIIVGHRDLNGEVVSLLAEAFLEETGALLPIPLHDTAGRAARQEGLIQ
ncbi:MAG: TAXI family TRAP transporter solute-binding subunit [Bacillota bacterium]